MGLSIIYIHVEISKVCTCILVPEDCYKGAVLYMLMWLSSGIFNLNHPLHPYFVCANCEVSICAVIYKKYQILINWLVSIL